MTLATGCSGRCNIFQLIFDNRHFVAVDKPAGWLSVPSRQGKDDPRPCLGPELEGQLGQRLWPVHRLDFEVTGVILFAKDAEAHRQANDWFEGRNIEKTYEALSEGDAAMAPSKPEMWRCQILRGKKRAYESPHGKASETEAAFLGEVDLPDGTALHWRLCPLTGRPHQLRFELARHGFPIVGDQLYGAKRRLNREGIGLRCVRLNLGDVVDAKNFGLPSHLDASPLLTWIST